MTDDIVSRLRIATLPSVRCVKREAADEIERLRSVVEAWQKYSQRAERDIETLRAERDEARRGLCYEVSAWVAMHKHSTHEAESRAEADRRGWDCFKEAVDE